MLEEITKGICENGIMKIDIQDTNAFSIREDIVQVSGNYEVIYAAGYGHRRLVYNIVATYFREQITYLQILEMGKYHSTSYRVKAVNEDYYKIAENEILYLEANHNHVVWNCINGKIVALDSTPKIFQIAYPMFDSDGKVVNKKMDIPQICLLPMSSLKLDEVEVDFKVKLYGGVKLKTGIPVKTKMRITQISG